MGWADNDGMRFGLVVPQGWRNDLPGRDFERMVSVTQAAERLGFDSIWLYDHLQTRDGDPAARNDAPDRRLHGTLTVPCMIA